MTTTGRAEIYKKIEEHEEGIKRMKRMLELIPEELLDAEVEGALVPWNDSLVLDVTPMFENDKRALGKLMLVVHRLNNAYYVKSRRTEWTHWYGDTTRFSGVIYDEDADKFTRVRLERKGVLGPACKKYRVRDNREFETIVCGEVPENYEILEVIE